jgi:hypothetical protein
MKSEMITKSMPQHTWLAVWLTATLACGNEIVLENSRTALKFDCDQAGVGARKFAVTALVYLNTGHPLLINPDGKALAARPGQYSEGAAVQIVNHSPHALPLSVKIANNGSKNWDVKRMNRELTMRPYEALTLPIELKAPAPFSSQADFSIHVNYCPELSVSKSLNVKVKVKR